MNFDELGLSPEVLKAVSDSGYTTATPIQEKAIPYVLMARDVLGVAQTGTGKTASFVLPMIDVLAQGRARARMPRSLILEPTRELAAQVAENFIKYGKYNKLEMALLIGGERFDEQVKALEKGVDVLIATPGRLLDLIERGNILLADTKLLVIDEADRMLDMGFIPDVERIVGYLPKMRQTLFFSATMEKEIRRLADAFLINPKEISAGPPSKTADTVTQHLIKAPDEPKAKRATLRELLDHVEVTSALVFCNRKRDVGVLHRSLERRGYSAGALHGDMAQPARMATLAAFKKGEIKILVCSDVAARGLDIPAVSHVFNFDVPSNAEDYVHRIGRTGRAGRSGISYTLSTRADRKYVAAIEQLIGRNIQAVNAPEPAADAPETNSQPAEKKAEALKQEPKAQDEAQAKGEERKKDTAPKKDTAQQPAQDSKRSGEGRREKSRKGGKREDSQPRPDRHDPFLSNVSSKPFGDDTPAFLLRPVPTPAN
ncbi:MAG: DEAD/DEAH box helicase [Rhodovibrionaceae bacterium]